MDKELKEEIRKMIDDAIWNDNKDRFAKESVNENVRYCYLPIDVQIGMHCVVVKDTDDAYCWQSSREDRRPQGVIIEFTNDYFSVRYETGEVDKAPCVYLLDEHRNEAFRYNIYEERFIYDFVDYMNAECSRFEDNKPYNIISVCNMFNARCDALDKGSISCYYHIYGNYMTKGRSIY